MALDDLDRQGLLLPREQWGSNPSASWRGRAQILVCGTLFLAASLLIWLGDGTWITFAGLGAFFLGLFLFLVLTFRAVDHQVNHLLELGAGGQVEGLAPAEDERPAPGG